MVAHKQWYFEDTKDPNVATRTFTLYPNPSTMSSPFPTKEITALPTTALNGQTLYWEGQTTPVEWSFGGTIRDAALYEALRAWVYARSGPINVYDHFGRRITVLFRSFAPEPPERAKGGVYWYHKYTITALVMSIGAPKTNEVPA